LYAGQVVKVYLFFASGCRSPIRQLTQALITVIEIRLHEAKHLQFSAMLVIHLEPNIKSWEYKGLLSCEEYLYLEVTTI
jgi:hypothetical protein